jgi:hypothetical protein
MEARKIAKRLVWAATNGIQDDLASELSRPRELPDELEDRIEEALVELGYVDWETTSLAEPKRA